MAKRPAQKKPARPRIVKRRTIHKGRKFDFEMLSVKHPGGKVLTREVVRHPGAVVIVPITDDGRLVLVRVFRVAVGKAGEFLVECCAGTLEPPEKPANCAKRELIEETGYTAATMTPLGWFHTTPGLTDEKMHAFVARGLTHVGQDLEEDESIEVLVVPIAEALDMIRRGELRDAKSMLAILLAQRDGYFGKQKNQGDKGGRR